MKVFLKDNIHGKALEFLNSHMEVIDDWNRIEQADAILVRKLKVTREMIERAKNLKVIGFHGAGLNGIDLDAAREHNIEVFSVPGLNADSVAELNVALALDVAHMISQSCHEMKEGISMKDGLMRFIGHEIGYKTAGIIGMGQVGSRTARILKQSFHMNICTYSQSYDAQTAAKEGYEYTEELDVLLKKAEFIFLSVPCTPETERMINEEKLRIMRKDAILINTARGKLVDEIALKKALEEKWIRGAASDVFETEPVEPDNPLLQLDNFIATPHIGGNTQEALYRVGMGVAQGIYDRLRSMKKE